LIEVQAREWVDLARYSWARDLLLPVGSIREHALAEADAAGHPGFKGAPEAALNFLLLLSAAEQVTADYLGRGGLDLSPLRKAMGGRRIAAAALSGLETAAEHLCSIRASIGERGIARQLEDLRGLALEVATAIAGGKPRVAIDPSDVARRFPSHESALTRCRMKSWSWASARLAPTWLRSLRDGFARAGLRRVTQLCGRKRHWSDWRLT
jgi:hypothetical protein